MRVGMSWVSETCEHKTMNIMRACVISEANMMTNSQAIELQINRIITVS